MSVNTRLTVTHFYREPSNTGFSVEGVFKTVKNDLADRIPIRDFFCSPGTSHLKTIRSATKHASAINHLTGDTNFLALGLKGQKNILTIHDFGRLESDKLPKLKQLMHQSLWYTLPIKNTRAVTLISESSRQKFSERFRFPAERIHVIPAPVKPIFKYMYRDELAVKPTILMLGTGYRKNLHNLLEAVKDMNVHIDIVGEPSADDLGKLKAHSLSHTLYHQLSDEQVLERYIQCDILFSASFSEGCCMPLIEAQAVGRPVVASNIDAVKEIANNSALLVDPTRPDHIRDAISTLIADRQRYGALVTHGLRNAARFNHKLISEQYFRLYLELHKL